MALMDKAQLKEFIKTNNIKSAEDIQSALKDLFKDTLQEMLEAELDSDLGYTKHDDAGKKTENRRNGHSSKTVRSEYGELEIDIPRDREGEIEPIIVKRYQKNVAGIEDQIRNSIKYVSYKDVKKITSALKPIYTAASEIAALDELDGFEQVWGDKYPLIVKSWRNNWSELSTFFKYSPEIRKLIYTTNMIESYHRQLRKVTKGKSIFPNNDALLKMLYLATQNVTRKWTGRIQNWGQILLQLSIYFPDKVQSHLV